MPSSPSLCRVDSITETLRASPDRTIVHGDAKTSNLFFARRLPVLGRDLDVTAAATFPGASTSGPEPMALPWPPLRVEASCIDFQVSWGELVQYKGLCARHHLCNIRARIYGHNARLYAPSKHFLTIRAFASAPCLNQWQVNSTLDLGQSRMMLYC